MSWTTPDDVSARLLRAWDRGKILAAPLTGDELFPMTLSLRRPSARALSDRFDEVRGWIRLLEDGSKSKQGAGYEIHWAEINSRALGPNRVPEAIVIPTEADALELIGKRRQAARFRSLHETTMRALPQLAAWAQRRPMKLLEHEASWERVLAVLCWFVAHPRPGLYLRQVDIAGVDTKFIESNRGLFTELLDEILPADAIVADAASASAQRFEQRYGLRSKPQLVRFRILDARRHLHGLSDLSIPLEQLAELEAPAQRIFIAENDINGLAFPPVADGLVIFGLGYGVERLSEIPWLRDRSIYYWGDLDTHGFAILDRLRRSLGDVRSLLMDRETLLLHRSLWVTEHEQHRRPLTRLTEPERALFEELVNDSLGVRVRLEQERIAFGKLVAALQAL
jgi:hypothetical protein